MPRTAKPLTDTEIKKSKARKSEFNLADGQGLYLRIKPSGYKVWIFNYYRPYTKRRAVCTIGGYLLEITFKGLPYFFSGDF